MAAVEILARVCGSTGRRALGRVGSAGRLGTFAARSLVAVFRPPLRLRQIVYQIRLVGSRSVGLIVLTAAFTGLVLVLQGESALARFGTHRFLGALVALSLVRELGPVLAALMLTARAGSATAAVVGEMRVSEQIDALEAMAVDPIHYLVGPRLVASLIAGPIAAALFSLVGLGAGLAFGVAVLGLDGGSFMSSVHDAVRWSDVSAGLVKSIAFGACMAWIACYRGYHASGGAEGVGRATARAVVDVSAVVLLGDYVLTALLFRR